MRLFSVTRLVTTFGLACGLAACGSSGGNGATPAPTELAAMLLSGGAHLTWKDNSTDEGHFAIERKTGAVAFQQIATVPFNTTQYHDATTAAGSTYTFRVGAAPPAHGEAPSYSGEVSIAIP